MVHVFCLKSECAKNVGGWCKTYKIRVSGCDLSADKKSCFFKPSVSFVKCQSDCIWSKDMFCKEGSIIVSGCEESW
jgi:hypothetical protein